MGIVGRRLWWIAASAIPLVFLAFFFLWPVVALVSTGLFNGGVFDLSAFASVFGDPRSWRVIGQTLVQAVAGTAASLVLGVPSAFVLYRLRFRGQAVLRGLATVPFVLPTVVVGVAFMALVGPGAPLEGLGLDQSLTAIVLALTFFNTTVVIRTVGSFWAQLDGSAAQTARVLGASPARAFFSVTLPALWPAIASAAALAFLFCATSFGVVLVLGGRSFGTVETEIYRLTVQLLDLRGAAVLSIVQFLIVGAVLLVSGRLRRTRERAVTLGEARPMRPERAHAVVFACYGLTLVLQLTPLFALVIRSLRDANGWTVANYARLLAPPKSAGLTGSVVDAIGLSLGMGALAVLLAVLLGVLAALVLSRRPQVRALERAQHAFDGVVMLPLGMSAVTLGFGLLLTMHHPLGIGLDLRSSVVLIPVAQALVALPLVVRTVLPALRGVPREQCEAARVLGASGIRVFMAVEWPVLRRSLGFAAGFAAAAAIGEFGATAFLVRPGAQTLPVVIANLMGRQGEQHYGMALAASVVLGVMVAAIMLAAERARRPGVSEW